MFEVAATYDCSTRVGVAQTLARRRFSPQDAFDMFVRLSKTFHFEAAHSLPTFPEGHKCRRLHGHSFRFDVVVEGEVDPAKGFLIDYGDIKRVAEPIVDELDHRYLNDIAGLANPTAEGLAAWLFARLETRLPAGCKLAVVKVHETCTSSCEYFGPTTKA